ncbi:hypothetical protein R5O11_03595 [Tenacibaculum maritimum]|uniref:DUF7738 domain-containing protein n=1 Tax=Tenacibaculum maritimum TaxID=107401 RepID=UPI003876B2FB
MKQYTYLIAILFLTSCKTSIKKETKDTNSPAYKAFMAQKHRFELNGCELTYNGKPFRLGMSLKEFEKVFGKYDKEHLIVTRNERRMVWGAKSISVTFFKDKAIYIYLYIESDVYEVYEDGYKLGIKGIPSLIFNNYILERGKQFQEFIKSANINVEDSFIIDTNGYEDVKYCEDKNIRLYLASPVIYHRKGGGHLYVKGKWNMNETSPIQSISVSYHIE